MRQGLPRAGSPVYIRRTNVLFAYRRMRNYVRCANSITAFHFFAIFAFFAAKNFSVADFVRDPEAFSAASMVFSGALDKAASSRRTPRRKRSPMAIACANSSLLIPNF